MTRFARTVLAATLAILPFVAFAGGYQKTSWGMSLEQVKKLYPGGTKEAEPDGTLSYFVVRKVEGLDAMVGFTFEEGRLTYVAERFPMPGEPIDKKGLQVAVPTNERAEIIATKLRKALESRYGKPFADAARGDLPSSPFIRAAWIAADGGTMISLDFQPMTDGPYTVVGVSYGKWPPR